MMSLALPNIYHIKNVSCGFFGLFSLPLLFNSMRAMHSENWVWVSGVYRKPTHCSDCQMMLIFYFTIFLSVLVTFNKQAESISLIPVHHGLGSMKFSISLLLSGHFAPLKGIAFHIHCSETVTKTGWLPKFWFWSYDLVPWGTNGCQALIWASAQDARL